MDRSRHSRVPSTGWVSLGLLLFAFGVLLLAAGVMQRYDGRLSWGPRSGPMKTLERDARPEFFDQVTYGLIASGSVLIAGGFGLAWLASGSRKQR